MLETGNSRSVIERTVNSGDVPLLGMHPLEQGSTIQCQGGREAAREIHMISFDDEEYWCPICRPRADRRPASRTRDTSEPTFGFAPISAKDLHGLLGVARQDGKRQPINREGEAGIHGLYRTLYGALRVAPRVTKTGPFAPARRHAARTGLALNGVTDSTVLNVLPESVGCASVGRHQRLFLRPLLPTILIASVLPSITMLIRTAPDVFGNGCISPMQFFDELALLFSHLEL